MTAVFRKSHVHAIVDDDPSKYVPPLWRLVFTPANLLWLLVGLLVAFFVVATVIVASRIHAPSWAKVIEAHWLALAIVTALIVAGLGALRDAIIERRAIRRSVEQSIEAVRSMQEKGEMR
jgi:sensor histidine kinase regulating citrate/malate metabolism